MTVEYPIILTPTEHGYAVYVPDMEINTEGITLTDAISMASDAIGLWGIAMQNMGKEIPRPASELPCCKEGETVTYAPVDFDVYRNMKK